MPSILIIDDNKDFRDAMKDFILIKGVKADILEAMTGEEGVKMAAREEPDIVIIDIYLGSGINGLQTAALIKRQAAACGVIMLTMYDMGELKDLCKTRDIDVLIDKSDLDISLIPAINRLLSVKTAKPT